MSTGVPIFYPASPIEIRDGTALRLAVLPGLTNVYKARTTPGQDDQLPYACVWYAGERTQPNGDANTGTPSFLHTLTLVVDVMTKAGDDATLDTEIVGLVETARATLMTDPTWISLFEGIEKIDTRYSYPKEASDVVVQAIIEIEVTFRSRWEPVILHDLKTVAVTVERCAATWTCGTCSYSNPASVPGCQSCGAKPTSFAIEFDLDIPPC